MYQRGNRTPAMPAIEIAITTDSKAMPRNALGKPSSCACQVRATVPQEITELMSQVNVAAGFAARCHASIDSTNDVNSPMTPDTAISIAVRRRHAARAGESGSSSTGSWSSRSVGSAAAPLGRVARTLSSVTPVIVASPPGSSPDIIGAGALVLGCDSMLELDGQVLGKPADAADAAVRWRAMRGRSGRLHTGHWLVDARAGGDGAGGVGGAGDGAGRESGATSTTVVHFADVTDAEIDAYVATGEPLWVAGAFTIDGLGGAFITGVEGDHHGVVGLSLPLLRELLAARGVPLHTLWARL